MSGALRKDAGYEEDSTGDEYDAGKNTLDKFICVLLNLKDAVHHSAPAKANSQRHSQNHQQKKVGCIIAPVK